SLALGGLGVASAESRRYHRARRWLSEVVQWCLTHDLDAGRDYYRACLARCDLEQGHWSRAQAVAGPLAGATYPLTRVVALTVLGQVAARRGAADAGDLLAEAWQLAAGSGNLSRRWRVAAARAEHSWLTGRPERIPEQVVEVYQEAVRAGHPWAAGELAYWRWRAGARDAPPDGVA